MNEQAKKATKRTRRWLKVSLRTFLLAITVLCVWLGFIVNRANKQKQAVAWVRENGGTVDYDFEWDDETFDLIPDAKPPGPDWLRESIGIDYLAEVKYVDLSNTAITDVKPLAQLTGLIGLHIEGTQISDVSPLAGMNQMRYLQLADTQVSDLTPLSGMKHMTCLELSGSQVTDLSPLGEMIEMEDLYLCNTQVSSLAPVAAMIRLKHLLIENTHISDLTPLSGMTRIKLLYIGPNEVQDLTPLVGTTLEQIYLEGNEQLKIPPELNSAVYRH